MDELRKRQEEIKLKKMQQPATPPIEPPNREDWFRRGLPNPSLEDFFRDNPMPEPKKVGKPVSNEDEILSPIRKYENNLNVLYKEKEVRNQLKNQGKTNAQIGQLIYHMKKKGQL